MKVGVLTGGGDCPGLNAAIRAVVRKGIVEYGFEMLGIENGWLGLVEDKLRKLTLDDISGILFKGGTILGTSRTNPFRVEDGVNKVLETLSKHGIDALVVIGGDDTLSVAARLYEDGVKCVGIPKTIDNDVSGTDYTIGFDTAVSVVMEALDRLHPTAEAHHRVMVVEVMGRHAGWIAVEGGIAGGADYIVIPEIPFDIDELCNSIKKRHQRGKDFSIVVVAEGSKPKEGELVIQEEKVDAFGHVRLGGIGYVLAKEIEKRTGYETRVTMLGHVQRGGSPTAFDRILATKYGIAAIDLVNKGVFGVMVGVKGMEIVTVPLKDAVETMRTVDMELYKMGSVFFG